MNAIDTNVLFYSLDADEVVKQRQAVGLIGQLTAAGDTVLLWQVACEFLGLLPRQQNLGRMTAQEVEENYADITLLFPLALPTPLVLERTFEITREFSLSHWDSLLLAALCRFRLEREPVFRRLGGRSVGCGASRLLGLEGCASPGYRGSGDAAEVDGSGWEGELVSSGPEVELIASRVAAEAAVDVPLKVYREVRRLHAPTGPQRTGAAELWTAPSHRTEVQEVQDSTHGDLLAEGRVVDRRKLGVRHG